MAPRSGPQGGWGARPGAALAVTLGMHALVIGLMAGHGVTPTRQPVQAAEPSTVVLLRVLPPLPETVPETTAHAVTEAVPETAPEPPPLLQAPAPQRGEGSPQEPRAQSAPTTPRAPVTRAAPPAPSAEQWAFAGQYTLKNSKAYRHTWGQQVRSMMGTAVEGPGQGMVRFQVEIAADGRLVRLDTLWSTSDTAERLARQAVQQMPQWPATPTGRPLVFERTISFSPHAGDDPPLFRYDCLPDPPVFRNPFAWNGGVSPVSAPGPASAAAAPTPDPQALADCLKQLPQDSIDAESARDRRVMERWDFDRLGRGTPGAR